MANATTHLTTGLRVTVYGKPGVVVTRDGTDVTVRLDGETRTDIWQSSQVLIDSHEAMCPACDGEGRLPTEHPRSSGKAQHVACEECDGAGVMACVYCTRLADAGQHAKEWRCSTCHDEMTPAARSSRSRGPAADPDGAHSWRGGL